MARAPKEAITFYCGTNERVAKLTPRVGLNPSQVPVYLSDVYPGLFAFFASTNENDRFGIIEVDLTVLDPTNLLPCEWYLEQTSRQKSKNSKELHRRLEAFRRSLEKHKIKWKESLQRIGVCVYDGLISRKAIRRISIYDPASNPMITEAIVSSRISLSDYKKKHYRNRALTRWLVGDSVAVEEWLGQEYLETPKEEREKLAESLQNKQGLDIFFHEPPAKGH